MNGMYHVDCQLLAEVAALRSIQARMRVLGSNPALPFGIRYQANIAADDADDRLDRLYENYQADMEPRPE